MFYLWCYSVALAFSVVNSAEPPECAFLSDESSTFNKASQISPPSEFDSASMAHWLSSIKTARKACQKAINYNPSHYAVSELQWSQTAYISTQMSPYERFFFDPAAGNGSGGVGYTVDRWLQDVDIRYGGVDKALVWPTYPQLGIDDRSQWDWIRTLPGGAEALCKVVKEMQAAGVKVLWPYNPWDSATKDQERHSDTDPLRMAELLKDTCADGFNGDTMNHIPPQFQEVATRLYKPIAMEPELPAEAWDYNYAVGVNAENFDNGAITKIGPFELTSEATPPWKAPKVDRARWITNAKISNNWVERWAQVRIPSLQVCWFNGMGYEAWENVWGTWNQITARDAEAIRRLGTMLRFFGGKGYLSSADWAPHTEEVLQTHNGVYGSAWPLASTGETLWTLVNRHSERASGYQIRPKITHHNSAALHYYDCYSGNELQLMDGVLSFVIDATDFGCVIATPNAATAPSAESPRIDKPSAIHNLSELLKYMGTRASKPLLSFSPEFSVLKQSMVSTPQTPVRPAGQVQKGEVYVPSSRGLFHFKGAGVEIEGGDQISKYAWPFSYGGYQTPSGADVQFPWQDLPSRYHEKEWMQIGAMYVDKHPVTNRDYAEYLEASGYKPASDSAQWLKHWENGKPKLGWEKRPVTYVSLNDARAYCKFHKKRLPEVYEWQYFAQGLDMRVFPWGNHYNSSREAQLVPEISRESTNPGPEPVGKYPKGASPFGVEDLVGSVWQMTSEFQDERNRAVILRGGSNYGLHVNEDSWYYPPAFQNDQWNKYFLMTDGWERAGTLGFRCVADAEDSCLPYSDDCPNFSGVELAAALEHSLALLSHESFAQA